MTHNHAALVAAEFHGASPLRISIGLKQLNTAVFHSSLKTFTHGSQLIYIENLTEQTETYTLVGGKQSSAALHV